MAKRKRAYRGYYIGRDRNGKIVTVSEYLEGRTVILSKVDDNATLFEHAVVKGRQARTEAVIVFGLSNVEFFYDFAIGTQSEQRIIERFKQMEPDHP